MTSYNGLDFAHLIQRYVADFYISDFQSGLRALVKAGYGAKVAPFVKPATVVDVTKENRDLSPSFLRWLADRKLSSDDRVMRLKEGYYTDTLFFKSLYFCLVHIHCLEHDQNATPFVQRLMKPKHFFAILRYIKEGSTVSVMGVVRRQDNVLMVVPSTEPISTGCQWARCLLPTCVEGLIITCDDNQNADVVPV